MAVNTGFYVVQYFSASLEPLVLRYSIQKNRVKQLKRLLENEKFPNLLQSLFYEVKHVLCKHTYSARNV